MRKFVLIALSFCFTGILMGCSKTVAMVNNQPVTQKELDSELEKAGGKNMLETLINRKLVEQDATTKHVQVTDQEVDDQLNQLKKNFSPADQQSLTGDRLKELRDQIRFNLTLQKSILANVPEAQIRATFDKNKDLLPEVELSVIVAADEKQAGAIVDELHRGKDFAAMASQFSLDPQGRSKGGYVGFLPKGTLQQMSPDIAKAAFSLSPGEISAPVKTQKGYYILKVQSRKDTYEELKTDVERQIAADRAKSYLDDLRNKAKIDYKGEYAKKG